MYKNLIFDIDGTLWNSTGVVAKAWVKAARELGLPYEHITADRLKKEFGKPMNEIFDSLFPDNREEALCNQMIKLLYVYEHEFLEENTEDLTYEGVKDTIVKLAEEHNLFIVSNCQKGYIELTMKKIGITEYIKDFMCFGDTKSPKNITMEKLMERNSLRKADCCYIGDIQGDCDATRKAGIAFVHASWGFGNVEKPDYVYVKFSELVAL